MIQSSINNDNPAPAGFVNRVQNAVFVKNNSVNDFFGGWSDKDIDFLAKFQQLESNVDAGGFVLDWLGIKTLKKYHTWMGEPDVSCIISNLPIPDDSMHAEAIEYVAMMLAIERAAGTSTGVFTVFELGASYAPWATASAIVAKRRGFRHIHCVAVEASSTSIKKINEHAEINNLLGDPSIRFDILHAAVYTTEKKLFFPVVDTNYDNGSQVVEQESDRDYRGVAASYEAVDGVTLPRLSECVDRIDFLHMDLQGAEKALIQDASFVECLDSKVATLFLATQSRLIEGLALETLSKLGWRVVRERPTKYEQNDNTRDINGWTLRDGGQIWLNPRFSTEFFDY